MSRKKTDIFLAVLIVILIPIFLYVAHLLRIEHSWRSSGVQFPQTFPAQAKALLKKQNVSCSMAGTDGGVVSFEAPFGFSFQDTSYQTVVVSPGDHMESDFVSWSHDFSRFRIVELRVNGKAYGAKIKTWKLVLLYRSALRQNGLEAQFQMDTGSSLTLASARREIRRLDQVLFVRGIHRAYDYPYDRRRANLIAGLGLLFSGPLALLAMAAGSMAVSAIRYRIWLVDYNREHMEDWDRIAGTLPQFVSLREDGLDKPVPIYQRPGFRESLRSLFANTEDK